MKRPGWKKKIKNAMIEAGTYQPPFDLVIDQLAQILETRDAAQEQYKKSGGNPVVGHTTRGGAVNLKKNPALTVIQECNTTALAYWKELGLTASSFRRNGGDITQKKETSFEDLLSQIGV